MNKSILKNSFAGIAATVAAVSFGYFSTQYFGKYMMLAISTGMFGLGATVHRTQQSPHKKFLPETLVVTEPNAKLTQLDKEVKKQHDYSMNKSPAKANLRSITVASRFVRTQVKITEFASTSRSYGYCRKRLAICHQAKIKNSTKAMRKG
ncbi:MAG: hypothetical protein KME59_13745 [Trichormus sp. ATA11-4-KO1]|jgi:hypothetical protein|nr:hypothetical protein [Trichormus sp. ATA11-4-KO1]